MEQRAQVVSMSTKCYSLKYIGLVRVPPVSSTVYKITSSISFWISFSFCFRTESFWVAWLNTALSDACPSSNWYSMAVELKKYLKFKYNGFTLSFTLHLSFHSYITINSIFSDFRALVTLSTWSAFTVVVNVVSSTIFRFVFGALQNTKKK